MIQGKNFVGDGPRKLDAECPDVVFIGNARPGRGGRPVVEFLLAQEELPFTFGIWGRDWDHAGDRWIAKYRDFYRLQDLYFSAKAVLIDHQEPMAQRGFLKHQVLDVIAAGGLPVVDYVRLPAGGRLGTHWPTYLSSSDALIVLEGITSTPAEKRELERQHIRKLVPELTFANAARTVIETVENL